MIRYYGIRHHGPDSALRLKEALRRHAPDVLLIEAPADAESLVPFVQGHDLKPPVAILIYNPKNKKQASYFPFAVFSPEWSAIKYGLQKDIPVRFIDLPQKTQFGIQAEKADLQIRLPVEDLPPKLRKMQRDPLAAMARLDGYEDSERWWEVTFEHFDDPTELFASIEEMMTALREKNIMRGDPETLLREAHMRKLIRKALKEGYEDIAVVCGAWHIPALKAWEDRTAKSDNQLLRGLPKVNTKATWIPWSYDRLSRESGYGAGVEAPFWYEVLYKHQQKATQYWMSRTARALRKFQRESSPAQAQDAVRLAATLASIRTLKYPGKNELLDAAASIFWEGENNAFLIKKHMIIGTTTGRVSDQVPQIPLQRDLEKELKSSRLAKDWEKTERVERSLDLRKKTNRHASRLLHRLGMLDINWGRRLQDSRFKTGSFEETWSLRWRPSFPLKIIEMGMWGNTVREACLNRVNSQLDKAESLHELVDLLDRIMAGDLSELVEPVIEQIKEQSALQTDITQLIDALPAMIQVLRYGSTAQLDLHGIETVLRAIVPRICVALPGYVSGLSDDAAQDILPKLELAHHGILTWHREEFTQMWDTHLAKVLETGTTHPLILGWVTRLSFDRGYVPLDDIVRRMHFAFSEGFTPEYGAWWIEGFLRESALMLVHFPPLLEVLDTWIADLEEEAFQRVLPFLRRSFASFSEGEKGRIRGMLEGGSKLPEQALKMGYDMGRVRGVVERWGRLR